MPLPTGLSYLLVWKSVLDALWAAVAKSQTVVLVTVLVTTCVWLVLQWVSVRASRVHMPPGPPYPSWVERVFGQKSQEATTSLWEWYHQLSLQHGPIFTVKTGGNSTVVVCDHSITQEMLQRDYAFSSLSWAAWVLDCSSTSVRLRGWPLHCSVPSSYTDVNEIVGYYIYSDFFEDCVTSSLDNVISGIRRVHSEPFDPEPKMTSLAFDALYSLFFGNRLLKNDEYKSQILEAHVRLNELVSKEVHALLGKPGTVSDKSTLSEIAALDQQIFAVVSEELDVVLRGEASSGVTQGLAADLYYRCQAQGSAVDVPSLTRFLVDTFRDWLDTCRITLQWTLLYLGHFVYVQRQCQREIDSKLERLRVFTYTTKPKPSKARVEPYYHVAKRSSVPEGGWGEGDTYRPQRASVLNEKDGYAPCAHDRHLLTFTQAVLLEVTRLRPCRPLAAPCIVSRCTTLGGYDVPVGVTTVINNWILHHDPQCLDNPDNFQPRRFLDDEDGCVLQPESSQWMPGLTGQLSTSSAEDLLRLKLLLSLSSLLHNFNVSLCPSSSGHLPDLTPHGTLWLHPSKFQVILEARRRERRRPATDWRRETVEILDPPPSSILGVSTYAQPRPSCNPSSAAPSMLWLSSRLLPSWRRRGSLTNEGRGDNSAGDVSARVTNPRNAVAYYNICVGIAENDSDSDNFCDPDGDSEDDDGQRNDLGGPLWGGRNISVYRQTVNNRNQRCSIDR